MGFGGKEQRLAPRRGKVGFQIGQRRAADPVVARGAAGETVKFRAVAGKGHDEGALLRHFRHRGPIACCPLAMGDHGRLGRGPFAEGRQHAARPPRTAMRAGDAVAVDQAGRDAAL